MTTKIHALADALGNPVRLILTAGHVHDVRAAGQLLQGVACGALLGDKGYDADGLIEQLRDARIAAVIPPRSNRKEKRECDFTLYKERNLIERLLRKTQTISCDCDTLRQAREKLPRRNPPRRRRHPAQLRTGPKPMPVRYAYHLTKSFSFSQWEPKYRSASSVRPTE
jgi:transposase